MSERFVVGRSARLLEFLRAQLPEWKRSTLEQRIRTGCVQVNGRIVRRNEPLAEGDAVEVAGVKSAPPPAPVGFTVLHEDDELIAIHKPAGLLSVASERESERTALALVREHLSRPGRPVRLWPVHRLDRETSGVLLLAKSIEARDALQASWGETRKLYLAWVEGHPTPPSGVIDEPLWEDGSLFVRVGRRPEAKAARTRYATLATRPGRALLEVELDTGRRHQIRAHLAWLGHPIVGDPRYGTAGARMALHALRLEFTHPAYGRRIELEAPPPRGFERA